jgi:peptide/nickel transport system permease protein
MHGFLLSRTIQGIVVMLLVSVIIFGITRLAPGGPAILLDPLLDEAQAASMRQRLGLDDPVVVQYGKWLWSAVRLDLGSSFMHGEPVVEMILHRLPASLTLTLAAMAFTLVVGLPLAIVAAVRRNSWIDNLATLISFLGLAIPAFWLGIILIILFAVELRWLPSSGLMTVGAPFSVVDRLRHLAMPAFVLGMTVLPQVTRYARTSVLDQLSQDYVRTARAKGAREWRLLATHVLRNAMLPVITVLGYYLPRLVGGTVVVEAVFAWPGLGGMAYRAAVERDYPVLMGVTMLVTVLVVITNIVVDLLYAALDPRVRYTT